MAETIRRTFLISGYVNIYGVLLGDPMVRRSAVFTAGGYGWCIHYYPLDGDDGDCIGLYLQLTTRGARATAAFGFSLLDDTASLPPLPLVTVVPSEFDSDDPDRRLLGQVVPRNVLNEAPGPGYFRRDGLLIECTVTVVPPPPPQEQPMAASPPSDLMDQLRGMYESGHGADVTFSVGGGGDGSELHILRAHRAILAMRSPVFKAELYGEMVEGRAHHVVEVKDMRHDAFKALLRYIYTDTFTLPAAAAAASGGGEDDDDGEGSSSSSISSEMIQDVLVAADRYGVERLKLICERQLCEVLDVGNVAHMLAFADDHHCSTLREACIRFIATCDDRMEDLVATQGYAHLVSTRPLILIEVLEKSHKFRNR